MFKTFKKFNVLLLPIVLLILMAIVLFAESIDVGYRVKSDAMLKLPPSVRNEKKNIDKVASRCLVLVDSTQENNDIFKDHIVSVLGNLRVKYDLVDISKEPVPELKKYTTSVVVFQRLDAFGDDIIRFVDWVEIDGGKAMFFCTPDTSPVFRFLGSKLDIVEGGNYYTEIGGLRLADGFMIGGDGFEYLWDEPMATAQSVRIGSEAKVYVYSTDKAALPLVWSNKCGKGLMVMNNHGLAQKTSKGLTAAAYSLMEEVFVYPVINASSYFLDDFPSPVPMGEAKFIRQFFNRDISSFYSNVWWPDVLQLGEDYSLKFTGAVIEDYNETVNPPFPTYSDKERFNYFGAKLLDEGGEIGIHGYNHMPLVLNNFDLKGEAAYYKKWPSEDSMVSSLKEVFKFTRDLYPDAKLSTYVPPSNILSPEGRSAIRKNFHEIEVIASLYMEGEISYGQEFEVAEDGIVEFPRVVSGTQLDNYMYWAAINALNLYYVNSHFMHPDDTLDIDRGADMGWEAMKANLVKYIEWVQESAPGIREMVSRDSARAIERYDVLSYERTDTEDQIDLRLFGFWDEAEFMIRINDGCKINKIEGGSIRHVNGDFYNLRAESANISIKIER